MQQCEQQSVTYTYEQVKVLGEKHDKQRKCFIFFIVLFFLTTMIFFSLFLHFLLRKSDSEKLTSCTSRDCLIATGPIVQKMNLSADPCEDFTQYACGQFYKDAVLPEGETVVSAIDKLATDNMLVLKDIVETKDGDNAPKYLVNIKRYYKTCMDEEQIEKRGVSDFLESPYAQAFPTLNPAWDEATFNLNDIMASFQVDYLQVLFSYSVAPDRKNSSIRVLELNYPDLHLENVQKKTNPVLKVYKTFLTQIAVILGANESTAKQDMKDVADLMHTISNLRVSRVQQGNVTRTYNPTTLGELKTRYPWIDIKRTIQAAFSTANITLKDSQPVNNQFPEYFDDLKPIIEAANKRTVQNMFGIKAAMELVGTLTKALRAAYLDLTRQAGTGATSELPRWRVCVTETAGWFGLGMGRQYVNRMFSQESKTLMNNMIDRLFDAFNGMLEENTWMSSETKRAACEKLANMGRKIGYPDRDFDDAAMDKFYAAYTMTTDNYYKNKVTVKKQTVKTIFPELLKPVDEEKWTDAPFEGNAFYEPLYNQIVIPAGIIQPPLYSPKFLDAINYGAIGFIIGHEITHGFDNSGSLFDKDGNVRNWWQPKDKEAFDKKTQCVVDQYSKYKPDKLNATVNGKLTLGENVADIGGLKQSYRAYKMHAKEKGEQLPLPGLNLTLDQLFFLSFAQSRCQKNTLQGLHYRLHTDPHSPGEFRILGSLQNSKDFAAAYNCPVGSKMNPKDKCEVW